VLSSLALAAALVVAPAAVEPSPEPTPVVVVDTPAATDVATVALDGEQYAVFLTGLGLLVTLAAGSFVLHMGRR
jgi:hypothetical protein